MELFTYLDQLNSNLIYRQSIILYACNHTKIIKLVLKASVMYSSAAEMFLPLTRRKTKKGRYITSLVYFVATYQFVNLTSLY